MMTDRKQLDPAKTRESIFSAAIKLFAEQGYEGASIADVADAAGVPKSLVQYHFGSKFGLWSATMGDRAKPMIAILERAAAGEVEPRELVAARFEMMKRNPEMARILTWFSIQNMPLPEAISDRLDKIRSLAVADDGIRMELLLGFCAIDGWMQNKSMYAKVLGPEILESGVEERFAEMVLRLIDRMVCEKEFVVALAAYIEEQA